MQVEHNSIIWWLAALFHASCLSKTNVNFPRRNLFNQLDKKDVYRTNSLFDHIVVFAPLLDPFSFNNTYSAETLKNNLLDVTCNYHTCRCLLISSPQRKLSSGNQPTLTKPAKGIYIYSILLEQFRRFNVWELEKIDSLQKSSFYSIHEQNKIWNQSFHTKMSFKTFEIKGFHESLKFNVHQW